jgi:signal transduction histidine kinase
MEQYLERLPNTTANTVLSARNVLALATEQLQGLFHRPDPPRLEYEMRLRLEERRKECGRIARELHDTVFQGFLGASLMLQTAVDQTPADAPIRPSLDRALKAMQRAMDEGRVALQELHTSASAEPSLEEALYGLWNELTHPGVKFQILVEGQTKSLKPTLHEQVYLIAREAMLNALQHSGATSIEAEVGYLPRRLRMVVRDQGCGIDPQVLKSGRNLHWGLQGMRERAEAIGAQLRIWSRASAGTEVEISVPM